MLLLLGRIELLLVQLHPGSFNLSDKAGMEKQLVNEMDQVVAAILK